MHGGVAVINLLGQMTLNPFESPFLTADRLVEEAERETPIIVVDFHAEATSEKIAMAYYLAGRVTAVFGTHTHVQTNDARVLAGGTAAITDAGMTGPHDSVIGSKPDGPIRRFTTGFPTRLEVADGDVRIEGVARRVRGRRPRDELRARPRPGRPERLDGSRTREPALGVRLLLLDRDRLLRLRAARAARTRRTGRTTRGRATTSGSAPARTRRAARR